MDLSDGSDRIGSACLDGIVADIDKMGPWLRAVGDYIYHIGELVWADRGEICRGQFVNRYTYLSDAEVYPRPWCAGV